MKELKVKLGDKVKEGSVVLEAAEAPVVQDIKPNQAVATVASAQAATKTVASSAVNAPTPVATAASYAGGVDLDCDLLVLGGGHGGYSAAFRAADLGLKVVVVERYATLWAVSA